MANARTLSFFYRLKSSFWFLPMVMATGMLLVAALVVHLDVLLPHMPDLPDGMPALLPDVAPSNIRSLLSTIAGAIISGAAVTYSLTMVALSLAASQFGPRLLEIFMSDRVSQVALGIFVSTFLFCLAVLGYLPAGHPGTPFAAAIALVMALISFFTLIYFVHHVATSMRVETVIQQVENKLAATMDSLFPDKVSAEEDEDKQSWSEHHLLGNGSPTTLISGKSGYVQGIDVDSLLAAAAKQDLLIVLLVRTGDFIHYGKNLAKVHSAESLDEEQQTDLISDILIGTQRVPYLDVEFSLNQLVEIAIRALSPGINDTFTAISCIDRLGSSLTTLAGRKLPSPQQKDEEGVLRVVSKPLDFDIALDRSFTLIRQNSADNPQVCVRLLEALITVAGALTRPEDAEPVLEHGGLVLRGCESPLAEDRQQVVRRYRQLLLVLGKDAATAEDGLMKAGEDD